VPIVLKSGNPEPLEPLGPVQVCTGIALPCVLIEFYPESDVFHFVNRKRAAPTRCKRGLLGNIDVIWYMGCHVCLYTSKGPMQRFRVTRDSGILIR